MTLLLAVLVMMQRTGAPEARTDPNLEHALVAAIGLLLVVQFVYAGTRPVRT